MDGKDPEEDDSESLSSQLQKIIEPRQRDPTLVTNADLERLAVWLTDHVRLLSERVEAIERRFEEWDAQQSEERRRGFGVWE